MQTLSHFFTYCYMRYYDSGILQRQLCKRKGKRQQNGYDIYCCLGGNILCAVGNELYGWRYPSMGHYFTYNGKRKGQKLAYFSFKNYCVNRCRLGCDFNCCSIAIAKLRFWLRHKCAKEGFIVAAIIITIIGSALFECAGTGTKERVPNGSETKTMKESFALMWKCKPFRRILISGLLRAPLQLMMNIAMTLLTYYYCKGNLTYAFTKLDIFIIVLILAGGLFIGQFVSMAISPALMKKYETKKVYNLFSGLSAVAFALLFVVYLIAPTDLSKIGFVVIDGILFFGTGMGFGGVSVCQSVMISDCIDYEEYHNGYRPDGIFFSGQSFITKFSAGISSIISGYVFDAVGYTDININKMNEAIANGANFATDYTSYSKAMWFLISIPPAIGMLLAVIPTLKYEIDKKSHNKMLEELVKRHKQNNQGDTNG